MKIEDKNISIVNDIAKLIEMHYIKQFKETNIF